MKLTPILAVTMTALTCSSWAGTSISVDFLARDSATGNPGTDPLAATAVAGVVPLSNWNSVDDQYSFTPANTGVASPLVDSTGAATGASLSFFANDSWYNDVDIATVHTPNAQMMNGIVKANGGAGALEYFTFTGVPEGIYDLYVYLDMNGDGVTANVADLDNLQTFYITEQHQFADTNVFVQGTNTDPNGVRDVCNYVKLSGLNTAGRGSLGAAVTHIAGADGSGVAGLQLISVGPAATNAALPSFIVQPFNRRALVGDTPTLSVTTKGVVTSYAWYKNNALITDPAANTNAYTLPALTAADNGAVYYLVIGNNVGTVQSSNAVITIGKSVLAPGLALEQRWDNTGLGRTDVEAGALDSTTPNVVRDLGTFEVPVNQADNFVERIAGLFVPPVTGDYVFFVCSDDDSDLWISTDSTPANKYLIAQETAWSNNREWVTSGGGSSLSQKRSDQYQVDPTNPTTPAPFASGIHLVGGTSYYIEGDHHEGGGGDDFSATYKLIGEPDPVSGDPTKIAGAELGAFVPVLDGALIFIDQPPTNTTAVQSRTATFSILAHSGYIGDTSTAGPAISYQWQAAPSGSSTFTNVPGATGASLTTGILTLGDNGTQYRVHMFAVDAVTNSPAGTLSITPDTTPPLPVVVNSVDGTFTHVTLTFNELMDKTSAESGSSYKFTPGNIAGASASLDSSGMKVTITTASPLTPNVTNILAVTAKDLAGNAANATIAFFFQPVTYDADILADGPVAYYRFEETSGSVAHNLGSTGGDGEYFTGDESAPMASDATPSTAKGDAGPRPPTFAGFTADNHSATFDGVGEWVDTKNQYLQNASAFTLEYWVQPQRTNADGTTWGTRVGLVGQNDAVEYGFIDPGTIQIWTPNGGSLNSTYSFPDGDWHHVATIADGSSIKTYYDGVLQASESTTTGNYGSSGYNVHIGGGGVFDPTGNWFNGHMDEVAIFNKSIPADRVAAHYSAGKTGGVLLTSGAVTSGTGGGSAKFNTVLLNAGGQVILSWTGPGTLQQSSTLLGPWTAAPNQGNPQTNSISGTLFFRLFQ